MVPLFPGLPGGPELLVILLVMILVFGVPALLLLAGGAYVMRGDDGESDRREERIDELEAEVERLRNELEED